MRARSTLGRILTVALSAALAVLLTFALDWAAGAYLYSSHRNAGLIWGPFSTVRHTTGEFSYVARINNLGFRDRDFSPGRSPKKRAIVLGDSFTYGWGVGNDEPWPKVLDRNLNAAGVAIEIANLGMPGASPRTYADVAERAVPVLRPDLLIVAVVQADDLQQCMEKTPNSRVTFGQRARRVLLDRYPNLMQLISRSDVQKLDVTAVDLAEIWKKQVRDFTAQMDAAERQKFAGLAAPIRTAFVDGQLNPGLLYYAMRSPNFLLDSCDLETPAAGAAIDEMAAQLGRIAALAKKWDATAVVVSVPYPAFSSARHLEAMGQLGFAIRPELVESNKPDEAIERAARAAGLPCLVVTREFRNEARRADLFFLLDGHPNALGHRTYAGLLAPLLHPYLP